EIFLSEADQEIHNRFFPEPWQVALVLKPHTFHPMRAGFFFREEDGSIRADVTYREFTLEPLPLKLVQQDGRPAGLVSQVLGPRESSANGPVIDVARTVEPEPEPEPEPATIEPEPPRLEALPPPPMFLAA